MKPIWFKGLAIATLALALSGCKVELYSNLSEQDANQMLALLMLKQIPADKQADKAGKTVVRVEKEDFVNAVEVLRQNGLPRDRRVDMNDLFPSNKLVTSPTQERAKMTYLKEQQLETMLSSMDGVITAGVSIAQATDENGKQTGSPSAAVLIKYSPEFNLATSETQVKSLVRDSVPAISPESISVVMQPATFRYQPKRVIAPASSAIAFSTPFGGLKLTPLAIAGIGSGAVLLLCAFGLLLTRRRA